MPTFIKTGYWEKIQKGYKGWLNLDDIVNGSIGTGTTNRLPKYIGPNTLGDSIISATSTLVSNNFGTSNLYFGQSGSTRFGYAAGTATLAFSTNLPLVIGTYDGMPLVFGTNNAENIRIFTDGNVGVGTGDNNAGYKLNVNGTARVQGTFVATGTSYISPISTIGTYSPFSTFNVVNDGPASIAVDRFSTNTTSPHFNLRKSRGTSAAPTVVVTNDELGYVGFWGHDGTAFQRVGIIYVRAANVTGSTITPTMSFGTGTSAATNQYHITIYNSGNVAFGTNAPEESSAQVSMASTTKGFLPPRMTSAQKTAIATPAAGLVVYDTTLNKLCVYTGAAWQTVSSA